MTVKDCKCRPQARILQRKFYLSRDLNQALCESNVTLAFLQQGTPVHDQQMAPQLVSEPSSSA